SIHEMLVVAVVDVGQAFEARRQRGFHLLLAFTACAPWLVATRHLQNAVVSEKRHDAIEVMRVEGFAQLHQRCSNIHGTVSNNLTSDNWCASLRRLATIEPAVRPAIWQFRKSIARPPHPSNQAISTIS